MHLINSGLFSEIPSILVTGRGYPDTYTRQLVKKIGAEFPNLPALYFSDYDPHGVHIYLNFQKVCKRLKWAGIHHSDAKTFPLQVAIPFTNRDKTLVERLKKANINTAVNHQLDKLLEGGQKFELEALHTHGWNYAGREYLPMKMMKQTELISLDAPAADVTQQLDLENQNV